MGLYNTTNHPLIIIIGMQTNYISTKGLVNCKISEFELY